MRACARLKQPNSSMPDPTAICSSVTKTFIPHVRAWKQTRTNIQIFYCADTHDLAIRTDFGRNSLLPISTAYLNFTGLVILFYWSSHPYFFGHPIGYFSEIGSRTTKFLTYGLLLPHYVENGTLIPTFRPVLCFLSFSRIFFTGG